NIIDNIDERLVEGTAIAGDMAGHAGKVPSKFYSQIWRKLLPAIDSSAARFNRHELQLVRPRVIRGRPDNLAVDALLDHVRAPAAGARYCKQRGEHRGRNSHHVIADCGEPVE